MRTIAAGLVAGVLLATPAGAHHSAAMYDHNATQTLDGTVKEFQWTNPHGFIQLLVVDPAAGAVEWSIEMQNLRGMYRDGWRPDTLKAGDNIVVVVHPAWNGGRTVAFVSATDRDGRVIGRAGPR